MSLTVRLLLSFCLVVVTSVGVVAYLSGRATEAEFQTYVAAGGTQFTARVASSLVTFYAENGGWDRVGTALRSLRRSSADRFVLTDAASLVVTDTAGQLAAGDRVTVASLGDPISVDLDGKTVGLLYIPSLGAGRLGQAHGSGTADDTAGRGVQGQKAGQTPEEAFQASVSQSLVASAGIAGALALVLGALASWQIVRPLRWLTDGAKRLASGDLKHRVKVGGKDEVGQLAVAFNSMAEDLERDEQSRRNLLADVAHELRTPLTVIEGTAAAILDGVFEPTTERMLVIREESQLLSKTISDLRDLSLAETGRLSLERGPVDARDLAERAARGAEVISGAKGVTVELSVAADLPDLNADSGRLLQVLGNLLGNAIRHTPLGGKVTLTVGRGPEGALFSVEDTGEGIPAESLPYVFDRFYRVDRSRSRQTGGSGLGLAIARRLVEAHGGRISGRV